MADKQNVLPDNYDNWRKEVISLTLIPQHYNLTLFISS